MPVISSLPAPKAMRNYCWMTAPKLPFGLPRGLSLSRWRCRPQRASRRSVTARFYAQASPWKRAGFEPLRDEYPNVIPLLTRYRRRQPSLACAVHSILLGYVPGTVLVGVLTVFMSVSQMVLLRWKTVPVSWTWRRISSPLRPTLTPHLKNYSRLRQA